MVSIFREDRMDQDVRLGSKRNSDGMRKHKLFQSGVYTGGYGINAVNRGNSAMIAKYVKNVEVNCILIDNSQCPDKWFRLTSAHYCVYSDCATLNWHSGSKYELLYVQRVENVSGLF